MDNSPTNAELNLAFEISNCAFVKDGLKDAAHHCHKVVKWQAEQWSPEIVEINESPMHRPEPWTGLLSKAPIMFVASNPSFDSAEVFPNWKSKEWNKNDIAEFGASRFSNVIDRKFGATDNDHPAGADRTIGKNGELSKLVKHWDWVRKMAALVLEKDVKETSAVTDYVMTELVHCKSPKEQGVWSDSLKTCSNLYFERILQNSPAKLIFIAGVKAGKAFAENYSEIVPNTWGSWTGSRKGKGVWPLKSQEFLNLVKSGKWNFDIQMNNSFKAEFAGLERTFIYIARPGGGGGLYAPWKHRDLIHPELLRIWRNEIKS